MNLNDSKIEELVDLLKDCDDKNFNHFIWVSTLGDVFVEKSKSKNPFPNFSFQNNNILFWKGVFHSERGYVGKESLSDQEYIEELYKELLKNWQIKFKGHLEN